MNRHREYLPLDDAPSPFGEVGEDYPNHGWFNGLVDDVRIYDGAMDASQVYAVFQSSDILPGTNRINFIGNRATVGTVLAK